MSAPFAESAGVEARLIDEAADWLVRLAEADASEADRQACLQWSQRSAAHARAWQRAQRLLHKLGAVPVELAMPALDRPQRNSRGRALATLGKLALGLAALPMGWQLWRVREQAGWFADYRTQVGQSQRVALADGGQLLLNTDSAIDVRPASDHCALQLHCGEVLVEAGRQPLRLQTRHGRIDARGGRFVLRVLEAHARLDVLDGAVRVTPAALGQTQTVHAGQRVHFSAAQLAGPHASDAVAATAWTHGMLLADKMTLAELASELERYRRGLIHCDAALAGLRVSGAFPVGSEAATERTFAMLSSIYPLEVRVAMQGLWVSWRPRGGVQT
ncbi:FecR domain-containing protein [Uliginosibacterium sediminicola]|uniref:FecR domain-containing protein n=1 Tax=Uliginosibacterium sediminicola TaxID=2024550 RepID=A0ABU9YVI1_9RHOO